MANIPKIEDPAAFIREIQAARGWTDATLLVALLTLATDGMARQVRDIAIAEEIMDEEPAHSPNCTDDACEGCEEGSDGWCGCGSELDSDGYCMEQGKYCPCDPANEEDDEAEDEDQGDDDWRQDT